LTFSDFAPEVAMSVCQFGSFEKHLCWYFWNPRSFGKSNTPEMDFKMSI